MNLDEIAAYNAMYLYLQKFYERTHSDDVGALLGGMRIISKSETVDPAAWEDWMDAVKATINNSPNK